MLSWHPKADCSTIVGLLGSPASATQPSVVITEQGIADLFGKSQEEQARQLIDNAAHPNAREKLWRRGQRAIPGLTCGRHVIGTRVPSNAARTVMTPFSVFGGAT